MGRLNNGVEMVGHASIRIWSGGKSLLMDPWYVDPINCNSIYHWPPLVHDIATLAQETDYIYISHVHPDHFDPRTLEYFSKDMPIYIGRYEAKAFYNELKQIGFKNVYEVPFQELTPIPGSEFQICIFESDYAESAAYDSSIFVKSPGFTVFNNNDCLLDTKKYFWLKEREKIDLAFLGYSHASFFPICFEFPNNEKAELLKYWSEKHYDQFVEAAQILKPKLSFPFAMGIRFLEESMHWQNISFNRPEVAVKRLEPLGLKGDILSPGDFVDSEGKIVRQQPLKVGEEHEKAFKAYAQKMQAECRKNWENESKASSDLIERFRRQILDLWQCSKQHYPQVRNYVIAYNILGPAGGSFYFDFSKEGENVFQVGEPSRFDMKYQYPDNLLQMKLDNKIDWDELNFSNRLKVWQNKYAAEYYSMIRSEGDLLSRKNT